MASNGSDGSIIIDTELDNTGFEKGSDKLLNSVQKLTDAVNDLGGKMTEAFNTMLPILQSVASSATSIYSTMTSEGQQAAATVTGMTGAVQRLQSGVAGVDRDAAALSRTTDKLATGMKNGFSNAGAVLRFKDNLDAAERQAAALKARMDQMAQTRLPTAEYQEIQTAIANADQALLRLYDRQEKMSDNGVKQNSRQWRSLQYDIQLAEEEAARLQAALAALEGSGNAYITGADTEQYAAMKAQLDSANEQIARGKALIDAETLAQAQLNVQAAQEAVIHATTAEERQAALAQLQEAQASLAALAAQSANGGADQGAEEGASAWERFRGVLEKVAQTAWSAAKSLAGMAKNAIASGLDKLKNSLLSFNKAGKQTTLTSKGLVKSLTGVVTMLKSRIKRMFITYLMNEIKEAMSALVRYSSAFDQSVSGMRNAASELAANLSVSFSNIVNAVAPAITQIINYISTAVSYLNAFFAMLRGKSTVTVAKKQTDSYAESLDNAAGSAKNLKNKLLSFDELNVLSKDDSSSGGSGTTNPSDLYEDVSIDQLLPEDVSDWFEEIKAAFDAGDWEGVGTSISNGLNKAVDKVNNWIKEDLQPKAEEWAENIAELLNGLVNGLNWPLMGETLANGINTGFDALLTLLDTFDFVSFGEGIGGGLAEAIKNLDTESIGSVLAYKVKGLLETAAGLVNGFSDAGGWTAIGEKLAEYVNGWFDTLWSIDWTAVGNAIGNIITGLPQTIITFLQEVDWKGHAEGLSSSIIDLCTGIAEKLENYDWNAMGSELVNSLITAITDFFGSIDWSGVVSAVSELHGAIIGGAIAALDGIAEALWGLIEEAWNSVVEWWHDTAFEDGQFTIQGLLDGISNIISNIGTWIKEHIFQPFIDGFKKAFGIASPSTVMAEQGNFVIEGLLQGITNAWGGITGFFSGALSTLGTVLSTAWDGIKTVAGTAWDNLKSTVTTAFDDAKTSLGTTADTIKTTLSNAWDSVKDTAGTMWNNLKSTVTTAFNGTNTDLGTTSDNVKTTLSNAWDSVKDTAGTMWGQITTTVTGLWNGLYDDVDKTDWASIGGNLVSGVKNGISNGWSNFTTWFNGKFGGLVTAAKKTFGINSPSKVFAEIGEYLDEGLMVGLQSGEGGVLRSVRNLAENVTDTMGDADPQIEVAGDATLAGMDSVAGTLGDIADKFSAIAAVLDNMGGLQVPSVAAGTVIPYQARVAENGKESLESVFAASNEELISVIIQSVTNATAAIVEAVQSNGNTTVVLDTESLTTGIVNEVNRRTLRSGRAQLL